jgi:hypothetical protein
MGKTSSTHAGEEECIRGFGGEPRKKETGKKI